MEYVYYSTGGRGCQVTEEKKECSVNKKKKDIKTAEST
jgi:hypothetical protein